MNWAFHCSCSFIHLHKLKILRKFGWFNKKQDWASLQWIQAESPKHLPCPIVVRTYKSKNNSMADIHLILSYMLKIKPSIKISHENCTRIVYFTWQTGRESVYNEFFFELLLSLFNHAWVFDQVKFSMLIFVHLLCGAKYSSWLV